MEQHLRIIEIQLFKIFVHFVDSTIVIIIQLNKQLLKSLKT